MAAPIIYPRSESGLSADCDSYRFGELGPITAITIHHSAGPRATNKARAQELHRAFQRQHIAQGWGDIGYHFAVDDHGRIYRLRPLGAKGAHVGGHNTGNVGIMFHGNFELHRPTWQQRRTLKWLFRGGIYQLTGARERDVIVRGHFEWPGHNSNLCPGLHMRRHLAWRRNRDHSGKR